MLLKLSHSLTGEEREQELLQKRAITIVTQIESQVRKRKEKPLRRVGASQVRKGKDLCFLVLKY